MRISWINLVIPKSEYLDPKISQIYFQIFEIKSTSNVV